MAEQKERIKNQMSSTREDDEWPHDLIAFKWAETLSEDEQAELLASSLRRLQDRINATLRQREEEVRKEERERAAAIAFGKQREEDIENPISKLIADSSHNDACREIYQAIRRDSQQEGKQQNA